MKLAANSRGGEIAWGVVAGVMSLVYGTLVLVKRKSGKSIIGKKPKRQPTL